MWSGFWCHKIYSKQLKILLTRILVIIWSIIYKYKIKLTWVVRWNITLQLSGKKTDIKRIITSKQDDIKFILSAKSFFLINCPRCFRFIATMTLQLFINTQFFLTLITKPFGNKILFLTNIFAWKPSIKYSLHLIEAYTCFPALFLPRKNKKRAVNWADLYFEAPIFQIFKEDNIVFIF